MSSVCAKLDSKDADVLLEKSSSSPKKCLDDSKHLSFNAPEDIQESDGGDTGKRENDGFEELKGKETKLRFQCSYQLADLSPRSSSSEEEDFEFALQQLFSEPKIPVKLISAMKGGREKNGLSPRKLSVSWAPDVYDPPPSIVSHTRGKKQQKSKSKDKDSHKKNGKKGHKGNSSRGGGGSGNGKDKKQSRKNARNEFHVSNPDAYCGGSFFKTNLTKVHYSVAEAL